MSNTPEKLETVVMDEQFLAWYHKTDPILSQLWEDRCSRGEIAPSLVSEAIEWMEQLRIHETGPSSFQINSAERRLWEQIDKMTMEDPVSATNIAWFKRPVQLQQYFLCWFR